MVLVKLEWLGNPLQCCQLSRIIQETPDFGPYLPVSRLEYEISQIFTLLYTRLSDNKLLDVLHCLSYFTVNIERFLVNFGMVYFAIAMYAIMWNIANLWWSGQQVFFAQMTSYTMQYEVICHLFPINSQCLRTWGVDSPAFVICFCYPFWTWLCTVFNSIPITFNLLTSRNIVLIYSVTTC